MEKTKIDITNPDSVFLNQEYLEKLNQVPEVTDDEFRKFILTHNYEMPIELKKHVEAYMNNPLNRSDSRVLGWIKDWIEHPEKSGIYRDRIIFACPCGDRMEDGDYQSENGWSVEIRIFSVDF